MSDTAKIYVAVRNNGYEGFSHPLCAFTNEREARLYLRGASDGYSSIEIWCVPLDGDDGIPSALESKP